MKKTSIPKLQILVVDDEPAVSKAIAMVLEHDGHKVQIADSGETGLALFDQGHFDLVITDYGMQPMNGEQLAGLIKQRRPGQPVIMATASLYGLNTSLKPSAVMDFLLNKPFTLQELREAIARFVPAKKA